MSLKSSKQDRIVDLRAVFNRIRDERLAYQKAPLTEAEQRLDSQIVRLLEVIDDQQGQIDSLRKQVHYLIRIVKQASGLE